jgi:hypothetical protein
MGIPSVAILSRVIRLQPYRPGGGGKGIAPDPFACSSAAHELAALRGAQPSSERRPTALASPCLDCDISFLTERNVLERCR